VVNDSPGDDTRNQRANTDEYEKVGTLLFWNTDLRTVFNLEFVKQEHLPNYQKWFWSILNHQ
jgi:hypothetical protein